MRSKSKSRNREQKQSLRSFFDGAENPQRLTRVVHDEQRRVRHNRVGNVEFLEVCDFLPVSSTSSAVMASSRYFSFVALMIGEATFFVEIDLRDDNDFVALSVFEQGRAQPARRFLRSRRPTGVSFPACRNSSFQCKTSKFYASVTQCYQVACTTCAPPIAVRFNYPPRISALFLEFRHVQDLVSVGAKLARKRAFAVDESAGERAVVDLARTATGASRLKNDEAGPAFPELFFRNLGAVMEFFIHAGSIRGLCNVVHHFSRRTRGG